MLKLFLLILPLCLFGWWTLLWVAQDHLIFPRGLVPDPGPARPPPGVEILRLPLNGQKANSASSPPPKSSTTSADRTQGDSSDDSIRSRDCTMGEASGEPLVERSAPAGDPVGEPRAAVESPGLADSSPFVEAWVRHEGTEQSPAPLVMYFHGNGELVDFQQRVFEAYAQMSVSVAILEYRGYGRSGGTPSQQSIGDDARRLLTRLRRDPRVRADRIVYHGRSLGGAVAADLARDEPPAALVLESTFTSVAAMARRYLAPPLLVKHPYRTADLLRRSELPVLLFHGVEDRIIPVRHGRRLAELAPDARYVEYSAGHNDFPGDREEDFWNEVRAFLHDQQIAPAPASTR